MVFIHQLVQMLQLAIKETRLQQVQTVQYAIDMVGAGEGGSLAELGDECICVTTRGKPIKAKTVGQKQYVDLIRKNTIVLEAHSLSGKGRNSKTKQQMHNCSRFQG